MKSRIIYISICILLIAAIILRAYGISHNPAKTALREQVGTLTIISGTISTEPLVKDFSQAFIVDDENGNSLKVSTDRYIEYGYGDQVRVTGNLSSPRNFESNGGRVFDYINYLGKDGIFYEFKKAKVEILKKAEMKGISKALFTLKKEFLRNLGKVLGEPHAALAGGLVVGEKAALGKDLIDDFRITGLIHIVVLSGYNITIIAASIRRILSFLPRTIGIILGGIGIVLFGILVGGGATVVRSCIMAIIALFAELIRKDYRVLRALFIAGLLMLLQNPFILLYDPSFQLSFLATLGLILLSSPIEGRLGFITEKYGIRSLVASTFATQVFVSPYILYMMGQLSLIGVLVNILVLPVIPLTMVSIFIAGAGGFVSALVSQIAGWVSHILLSYELFMVENFVRLPFASLEVSKFSGWIVVLCYATYLFIYLAASTKFLSAVSQFMFEKKSST